MFFGGGECLNIVSCFYHFLAESVFLLSPFLLPSFHPSFLPFLHPLFILDKVSLCRLPSLGGITELWNLRLKGVYQPCLDMPCFPVEIVDNRLCPVLLLKYWVVLGSGEQIGGFSFLLPHWERIIPDSLLDPQVDKKFHGWLTQEPAGFSLIVNADWQKVHHFHHWE